MRRIGRYEICGLLGKGAMSTVYKARLPVIGKMVALKVLRPHPHLVSQLGMAALRQRFTAEAVTMARLHHPHLAEVWDFDEFAGQPVFVMEYFCNNLGLLIGETYRVENPSRPLPVPQTIHYGRQILEGLACLHQAEIIHRDIKPFNILLSDRHEVKISDLGMSRLRGEIWSGPPTLMVGSPYYAAPEQEVSPDAVDVRSDLYAVGVMLHRMLTGLLPEAPPSPAAPIDPGLSTNVEPGIGNLAPILGGVSGYPAHSPRLEGGIEHEEGEGGVLPQELGRAWNAFLRKATAIHPADRFPDAQMMLAALADLERLWDEQVRTTCAAPSSIHAYRPPPHPLIEQSLPVRGRLRRDPLKVSPKDAREIFDLDSLGRPHRFQCGPLSVQANGTIFDGSTGLTWQQGGSAYPLTWSEARNYVKELNRQGFAGISAWHLPTMAELLSLVTPTPVSGITCQPPIFNPSQQRLWSIDRCSFTAAWYVSNDLGFVDRQDFTCRCHVRAVCSRG
jgi:serine/threonine protein kinase